MGHQLEQIKRQPQTKPHEGESKENFMARCKRNKNMKLIAQDISKRSPYREIDILLNSCELQWAMKNPVATYGPPKNRPPSKKLKGTIFSYPNQHRH